MPKPKAEIISHREVILSNLTVLLIRETRGRRVTWSVHAPDGPGWACVVHEGPSEADARAFFTRYCAEMGCPA